MDFDKTESKPENAVKLDSEMVNNWQVLQLEAHGDFSRALDELNAELRTNMLPRIDGYHLTIVSPPESGKLAELTQKQLDTLHQISKDISRGEGITVAGIGYIDGAITPGIREADKAKKTSYVAVDIPSLRQFREEMGLPSKDFHITLGFEGGDIHAQVIGQNDKGEDILVPIPKKANEDLDDFIPQNITFGFLSGQARHSQVDELG